MDYLDLIDNMDLPELFGFLEYKNNYKDMMTSYKDTIAEEEFYYESQKENKQLKRLEKI